jgi:hypothetical protein
MRKINDVEEVSKVVLDLSITPSQTLEPLDGPQP